MTFEAAITKNDKDERAWRRPAPLIDRDLVRSNCKPLSGHGHRASYDGLDQFIATAAHDLNAPLRQIRMLIGFLRSDLKDRLRLEEAAKLDLIDERTKRLSAIVTALLEHTRASNVPLQLEVVDLNRLFSQLRADLSPLIEASGARIIIDDLPEVAGDPVLLPQLFENLISNAIKYRKRYTAPEIQIFHVPQTANSAQRICVKDNGIGVNSIYTERIFDPFTRLGEKSGADGAGIGLAIVKMIAAKHNWRVSMESVEGQGAEIWLSLSA